MTLTPAQKKILMIGVPAVAVLALFTVLRKKSSPSSTTGGTATDPATLNTVAATFAGQLADFETQQQQQFAALQAQIAATQAPSNVATSGTTSVTPAEAPRAPAPTGPAVNGAGLPPITLAPTPTGDFMATVNVNGGTYEATASTPSAAVADAATYADPQTQAAGAFSSAHPSWGFAQLEAARPDLFGPGTIAYHQFTGN